MRSHKPDHKQEKTEECGFGDWNAVSDNCSDKNDQHNYCGLNLDRQVTSLAKNQTTESQAKAHILETVRKQKPEKTRQLITLIQQTQNLPEKQITNLLMQLANEHKLYFKKETPTHATPKACLLSSNSTWYWATIALAIATTITVFTIPEDAYPVAYIRMILGVIFVLFLPGFAFIKALYPAKVPIKTALENMDTIERAALSLGLSLALTPIVGLILNYTPWGIRLTPVTLSLLALTAVFATAAIVREYQTKTGSIESTDRIT
jgi:hypothetical protein